VVEEVQYFCPPMVDHARDAGEYMLVIVRYASAPLVEGRFRGGAVMQIPNAEQRLFCLVRGIELLRICEPASEFNFLAPTEF